MNNVIPLTSVKAHEMCEYPLPDAELELVHQIRCEELAAVEVGILSGELS